MPAAAVCFGLEVFVLRARSAAPRFSGFCRLARGTFFSFASLGAGSAVLLFHADAYASCHLLGVTPGRFEAGWQIGSSSPFVYAGRSCLVSPRLLGFRVGVAHGSGCSRSCRRCFTLR